MGYDYALVHLKYTIPPAVALTLIYRPLCTRLDVYKVLFLITIAVVSTIPWDSYLIRQKIWTYPPSVIIGPTLFSIPAEEVFFFIIQTYNTALLYLLLSKPYLKPCYLKGRQKLESANASVYRLIGHIFSANLIAYAAWLVYVGGKGTYMGLIGVWALPFAFLLRGLAHQLVSRLPLRVTLVPIVVPTFYLWIVDTLALQRGTWTIESGTKFGIHVWPALELEEAVFFLATNVLIVLGMVAFDNALAILELFPDLFPDNPSLPSPINLVRALLTSTSKYDTERILGVQQAVSTLQNKSRSFFLASSVFEGRLRIDLTLLYAFCRVADDLVDNAKSEAHAKAWIAKLSGFLDLSYGPEKKPQSQIHSYISENFPPDTRLALLLLPTSYLSPRPLYELLEGFKSDLEFSSTFPIHDESDLALYSSRVAGTVAESCLELVFHHGTTVPKRSSQQRDFLIRSGGRMGIALQYVNIARDVATDAKIGRVYIPTSWLMEEGLRPEDVISSPSNPKIEVLRTRLLGKAFQIYEEAKVAMNQLPVEAKAPMKVAVESYMEIGRCMRENGYKLKAGRATVPKLRRIRTAWKALNEQ